MTVEPTDLTIMEVDARHLPPLVPVELIDCIPFDEGCVIAGSLPVYICSDYHGIPTDWTPSDIDVFVAYENNASDAIARGSEKVALFTKMASECGYEYKVVKPVLLTNKMCIWDLLCQNQEGLPKVSFIARPVGTTREITQGFDIPICEVTCKTNGNGLITIQLTEEVKSLYKKREFYCRVDTTMNTRLSRQSRERVLKYKQRGFSLVKRQASIVVATNTSEQFAVEDEDEATLMCDYPWK